MLDAYRNISIGVLLMYLAVSEVWLNGGAYLYLMFPIFKAQGFYIQFGFHPAPEEASERHLLYEEWDTKVPLEKKLKESRSYLFWRGSVCIASELLMKKLNGVFIFKHMN
ncbi:hypothetical protein [Endozoicomonas lisbonensis]|uniref:hypothetical protein n=1 Tax=Endozoicomonas lisbonensis TaxID=3120522 RepID=UPI0033962259